jgi:hypothetical protein
MFRVIFCPSSGAIDRIFYSLWFSAPTLLPGGGPESRGADRVFGVEGAARQHPPHRTHGLRLGSPDHRPATTWVQKTTSCKKIRSIAPEDGQKIARNMLS